MAKGQNLTRELNTCLHTTTVQNKEENQLRELHSWACDSLMEYLQVLQPFASGSYARLDNIAHHLGVTDRYIGYRHNLTRSGNQPLSVHTVWADRKLPRVPTAAHQQSTPDWKNWVHGYRRMQTAFLFLQIFISLNLDYGTTTSTAGPAPIRQAPNQDQKTLGYLRATQGTGLENILRFSLDRYLVYRGKTSDYNSEFCFSFNDL